MTKEIKKQIHDCQKKKEEYLAGWKKSAADFQNYKKQEQERTSSLINYSKEKLICNILPILDNLYIAEQELAQELKDNQHVKAVLNIKEQILNFLKTEGVEKIEAIGKHFDPNFHEAVEMIEKKGVKPGIIVKEIQKGYIFNDKVIRPTKVKISK